MELEESKNILKKIKDIKLTFNSSYYCTGHIELGDEEKQAIETVLNLLAKYKRMYEKENRGGSMSREERIKVLNKYKSHNYDTLEFEDDEDIIEMCLKENQALEETIQDLKKLGEIENKLQRDSIMYFIRNENEKYIKNKQVEEYAKEILNIIKINKTIDDDEYQDWLIAREECTGKYKLGSDTNDNREETRKENKHNNTIDTENIQMR